MTITFRPMQKNDIDAVYDIECLSFSTPWTKQMLASELHNRHAHYILAEAEGQIIGYCGLWIIAPEAHTTNIAIHPNFRGRGHGAALLCAAMEYALAQRATEMTLEVREHNLIAQKLYAKFGFTRQGIRRGYYPDTGENALLLWNRSLAATLRNMI
ncbi:MAG: ribosomal protein S18-alanine N-acetyltransferase [Clostridiales bacterium]|nr:ribosomal protein S18-alanine N-acetyltransferase [Clostridiales bacterium]